MRFKTRIERTVQKLKDDIELYRIVLKDPRTPRPAKILLWLAAGYMFLPVDLIPDFLPGIGHLDDVIVISLLVFLALKIIPREVVEDCRALKEGRAGLSGFDTYAT